MDGERYTPSICPWTFFKIFFSILQSDSLNFISVIFYCTEAVSLSQQAIILIKKKENGMNTSNIVNTLLSYCLIKEAVRHERKVKSSQEEGIALIICKGSV